MQTNNCLSLVMLILAVFFVKIGKCAAQLDTNTYSKSRLLAIEKRTASSTDTGFSMWLKQTSRIDKIMGTDYAEKRVMHIIMQEDSNIARANRQGTEGLKLMARMGSHVFYAAREKNAPQPTPPDWQVMYDGIKTKYSRYYADRITKLVSMNYYNKRQQWPEYAHCLAVYYSSYPDELQAGNKNQYAWALFKYSEDRSDLKTALKWSKAAADNNGTPNPQAMDTYANLLYKTRHNKKAISCEEKAIILATEKDKKSIAETLKKMKNGVKTWP